MLVENLQRFQLNSSAKTAWQDVSTLQDQGDIHKLLRSHSVQPNLVAL